MFKYRPSLKVFKQLQSNVKPSHGNKGKTIPPEVDHVKKPKKKRKQGVSKQVSQDYICKDCGLIENGVKFNFYDTKDCLQCPNCLSLKVVPV